MPTNETQQPKQREHPLIGGLGTRLSQLPTRPGVYLMRQGDGKIIYVGKASSLRARISSYFGGTAKQAVKVRHMVPKIADFEFIVTKSPQEALILENILIKEHRPFFNVRLKDDKTYPYIKIDQSEEFPQVYFTRQILPDNARYFGPFASAGSVRKTMDLIKKLFPYRSCSKKITGTDERACLEFYIDRCVAPCTGAVDQDHYHEVINDVISFLDGNTREVLTQLRHRMTKASDSEKFEQAAMFRDQISAIESVSESQRVVSGLQDDIDVIALAEDKGEIWVEQFRVRKGRLTGRSHYLMEGTGMEDTEELLEKFIQQFYDNSPWIPPTILVETAIPNKNILEQWLASKQGAPIRISTPLRGRRKDLIRMVAENAKEGLVQRRVRWMSESDKVNQAMFELQDYLGLPKQPTTIECYDISNIQGSNAVGSMVVFQDGRPHRGRYRRFQIKNVVGINDYGSMQEVLRRRFRHLKGLRDVTVVASTLSDVNLYTQDDTSYFEPPVNNLDTKHGDSWGIVPDLVVIDGGKGHLSAVLEVFLELGIESIPLCSLAKENEEVFLPHTPEPIILPRDSQSLYLLQRIRDEAHRSAITYHRNRRSRSATRSILDSIPGVGPRRKKALLLHFGSISGIRNATLDEIISVSGITESLGKIVQQYLGTTTQ